MIRCKNLFLEYPDGESKKIVLNDINLTIQKGENVILVGPSGSGKSSLIYLLSCLRKPTSGEIFLDELNLSSKKDDSMADIRKKRFSFIFQMHFLLPYLTTMENILVAGNNYTNADKIKAKELLAQLGLEKHEHKKIHQMSGGERQRVAIARALFTEPDIIFADEPTASLDHHTAVDVLRLLKHHKKDTTLIMATHDTSILNGDERILKFLDGKIIE